ncbi:DUF4124 domain-containing protein [Pseudomonadota bacterium]
MWAIFQNLIVIPAAIATGLLACEVALGDFCKWTDENGVVHYAEECPENTQTEQVEIQPSLSREDIQEAQRRSEALLSNLETRRQESAEKMEKQTTRSTQADHKEGKRERCVDAMVDLHNLQEGEAIYFDAGGKLHDQFSIHSSTYSGERTYISDSEHKALIEAKQRIVQTDCVQSQDAIIARIKMLAARSDSQMCKNLYERVLIDKRFDRSADIAEVQSIEKTVLEVCN